MTTRRFTTFLGTVGVLLGGMATFFMPLEAGAQNSPPIDLSIGVTSQTVKQAAVIRYGYFHYSPSSRNSSSSESAQAFKVGKPKFALPSTHPPRSLAFNSHAADAVLSILGECVANSFQSDYKPTKQYYDKYSLSIRAKP